MRGQFGLSLLSCGLALVASVSLWGDPASDAWPTFRGPTRTATAPDDNLLKAWPEDGPELVWKAAGAGRGYSSLAIADGKLFTLGDAPSTAEDDNEYLTCFDLKTGEQLWKTKTGDAWDSGPGDWQSSRSTPTVDGDRVYVLTPHGKLVCCDIGGKVIFTKDLREDFEGDKADGWGYSESVTIDGDRLICVPGRSKNTMVALNKETGDLIWAASRADDRGAGHASVVIAEVGGTRVYVTTTGSGPMGVRADDGKLLWTYDIEKTTAVIPTPIVRDNLVFFSVGYGRGAALLRQVPGDDHTVTIEEVYPLVTSLANKHGGVVLVGDYVYGDSDDRGVPFCADLMTGELKWKSRGSGKNSASVAVADGHLYILYANGVMTLAKTNTGDLEEVGSFKLPGSNDRPSWSHPVIFDGKLYVRQDDEIFCYNVRAS